MPFPPSSFFSRLPRAKDLHVDIDVYINPILPPFPRNYIPSPLLRVFGHRKESRPDVGNLLVAFWACVGAFLGLVTVGSVMKYVPWIQALNPPVLIGSLGAAAVLNFNAISSPLAQPRNAVLGNVISAIIGVAIAKSVGLDTAASADAHDSHRWLAGPLACGLASAAMTLTNTVHPPGGATAMLAVTDPVLSLLGWWLVLLVGISTLLLLGCSLVLNNIQRRYPLWWWTPLETGRVWRRKSKHPTDPAAMPGSDEEKAVGGGSDTDVCSGTNSTIAASIQEERTMGRAPYDAIVLTADGLMNVPESIHLTEEERAVLERLLQKLEHGTTESSLCHSRSYSHSNPFHDSKHASHAADDAT